MSQKWGKLLISPGICMCKLEFGRTKTAVRLNLPCIGVINFDKILLCCTFVWGVPCSKVMGKHFLQKIRFTNYTSWVFAYEKNAPAPCFVLLFFCKLQHGFFCPRHTAKYGRWREFSGACRQEVHRDHAFFHSAAADARGVYFFWRRYARWLWSR